MKPINFDASTCNSISSNCVIWQGPDIPIINLCSGDSISEVVFALASELQLVMEQINVNNYDLSCFNITNCKPDDFNALIQFLITKICELEGITPDTAKSTGCPECMVSTADCLGAPEPLMNLVDYVNFLANKICSIIQSIEDLTTRVTNLETSVSILQNTPAPTLDVPPVNITCSSTSFSSNQVWTVVQEFINNYWCPFTQVAGTPNDIFDSLNPDCPYPVLVPVITPATTIAEALTNIWRVLCNLPTTVVEGISPGITVTSATSGLVTTYTVQNNYLETFTATLNIYSGYEPESGKIDKVTPSSVNGVQEGQVIKKYTIVSSNSVAKKAVETAGSYVPGTCMPTFTFGTFDNLTGIFTVTDPGTYLIHANIHLKPDSGSTEFWSGTSSANIGSFVLGLHPNNDTDTWTAQGQTLVPNIDRNVEISTSKVIQIGSQAAFRVKVLNTTNRNYNGRLYGGADFIQFSITKLRDNMTLTTCSGV